MLPMKVNSKATAALSSAVASTVFFSNPALAQSGERDLLIAFSGGGYMSHTTLSGIFHGLVEQPDFSGLGTPEALRQLFHRVSTVTSNSGGSWFMTQLAYSPSFMDTFSTKADSWGTNGWLGSSTDTYLPRAVAPCSMSFFPFDICAEIFPYVNATSTPPGVMGNGAFDWSKFVENSVFCDGIANELKQVTIGPAHIDQRNEWAREIDLIWAASTHGGRYTLYDDHHTTQTVSNQVLMNGRVPEITMPVTFTSLASRPNLATKFWDGRLIQYSGPDSNYYSDHILDPLDCSSVNPLKASAASSAALGYMGGRDSLRDAHPVPDIYLFGYNPVLEINKAFWSIGVDAELKDGWVNIRDVAPPRTNTAANRNHAVAKLIDGAYSDNLGVCHMLHVMSERGEFGTGETRKLLIIESSSKIEDFYGVDEGNAFDYALPRNTSKLFGRDSTSNNGVSRPSSHVFELQGGAHGALPPLEYTYQVNVDQDSPGYCRVYLHRIQAQTVANTQYNVPAGEKFDITLVHVYTAGGRDDDNNPNPTSGVPKGSLTKLALPVESGTVEYLDKELHGGLRFLSSDIGGPGQITTLGQHLRFFFRDECPGNNSRWLPACGSCTGSNPGDSDGDTVPNCKDVCPNGDDRLDADQDGIPDDCDPCPTWPHDCSPNGMVIYVDPGQSLNLANQAVRENGTILLHSGMHQISDQLRTSEGGCASNFTITGPAFNAGRPTAEINASTSNGLDPALKVGGGGTVVMKNVRITGAGCHDCNGQGGAIRMYEGATVKLENCELSNNKSRYGAAVWCENSAGVTLEMTNTVIEDNHAQYRVGGIRFMVPTDAQPGTIKLDGCSLLNNKAGTEAAMVIINANLEITNSNISGNTALGTPGTAIQLINSTGSISNSFFCDNDGQQLLTTGSSFSSADYCSENSCDYCDYDNDGVVNMDDICPDADDNLDTDGDSIANCVDPCPDWPGDCDGDNILYVDVNPAEGASIEDAIAQAGYGGQIVLKNGVHLVNEEISGTVVLDKYLTIKGESAQPNWPNVPMTVLRATNNNQIFNFENLPGASEQVVLLQDLRLENARGTEGGACSLKGNCAVTFVNCHFLGNVSSDGGGAVFVGHDCTSSFMSCWFVGNTCESGFGGAVAINGHANFVTCHMFQNNARIGGALAYQDGIGFIWNSRFMFNSSIENGGGINIVSSNVVVNMSTISYNNSPWGAGIACYGTHQGGNPAVIGHCSISSNTGNQGVLAYDSSPVIFNSYITANQVGLTSMEQSFPHVHGFGMKICDNTIDQIEGFAHVDNYVCVFNTCDADRNLTLDCRETPGFNGSGEGSDKRNQNPGPLVNTDFSLGDDGLEGWLAFNSAYGTRIGDEDWFLLPESFSTSVKLFGGYWGSENHSGVAQDICWSPGDTITFGADYIVRMTDPLVSTDGEDFYATSPNRAFVALNIHRLDDAGNEYLWYTVETDSVTGSNMELGVEKTMSKTYTIPVDQGDVITRVEYVIAFHQYDNYDPGSVFFTNAFAEVTCPSSCIGDVNQDGQVDSADMGLLIAAWGTDDASADFNDDMLVDGADLANILGYWGDCP